MDYSFEQVDKEFDILDADGDSVVCVEDLAIAELLIEHLNSGEAFGYVIRPDQEDPYIIEDRFGHTVVSFGDFDTADSVLSHLNRNG